MKLFQNPTKTEIMEQLWFEYLEFLKQDTIGDRRIASLVKDHGFEGAFWSWYMDVKMESPDASPPST